MSKYYGIGNWAKCMNFTRIEQYLYNVPSKNVLMSSSAYLLAYTYSVILIVHLNDFWATL